MLNCTGFSREQSAEQMSHKPEGAIAISPMPQHGNIAFLAALRGCGVEQKRQQCADVSAILIWQSKTWFRARGPSVEARAWIPFFALRPGADSADAALYRGPPARSRKYPVCQTGGEPACRLIGAARAPPARLPSSRGFTAVSTEIDPSFSGRALGNPANASRAKRDWRFLRRQLIPQQTGSPQESNRMGSKRPESNRAVP